MEQDKTALIIGGSGGIGAGLATFLESKGLQPHITGRTNKYKSSNFIDWSFKNINDTSKLFTSIPKIDILAICFGPLIQKPLSDLKPDDWQNMVSGNLTLPGILISHYLKGMTENNFGRIIMFGGTGTDSLKGYKNITAYSSAKYGLNVLCKSVAKEYGKFNIACNIIAPGPIDTEYYTDDERVGLSKKMPLQEMINMHDLDKLYEILIFQEKVSINGAIIACDQGGFR